MGPDGPPWDTSSRPRDQAVARGTKLWLGGRRVKIDGGSARLQPRLEGRAEARLKPGALPARSRASETSARVAVRRESDRGLAEQQPALRRVERRRA
jgi:hypothetical protein